MKKFLLDYQHKLLSTSIDDEHREESFYQILSDLLGKIISLEEFSILLHPNTETGNPDLKIKKKIPSSDELSDFIVIEVKNFLKFEHGQRVLTNVENWLKNPNLNTDSRRMYDQIFRYSQNGQIVFVTDLLRIWIIDFNIAIPENPVAPLNILYTYELCKMRGSDPSTIKVTKETEREIEHLANVIKLFNGTKLHDSKTLRKMLLKYIKQNSSTLNLRDEVDRILKNPANAEETDYKIYLETLIKDFSHSLLNDTTQVGTDKFIDLYVQLIIFGIFMLWSKHETKKDSEKFELRLLGTYISSNSLLLELININRFPKSIVDKILTPIESILNYTDYELLIKDIKHFYGEFYSDFLYDYDKKMSTDMGVVNTPDEVVNFIIKSVDSLLRKTEWSLGDNYRKVNGVLDKNIFFLDPAAGTMGFTANLLRLAFEIIEKENKNKTIFQGLSDEQVNKEIKKIFQGWLFEESSIPDYIVTSERQDYKRRRPYFLENVFAFEILMAPYVIGHLRTLLQAEELGGTINYERDRPNLFLTNTLMDVPNGIVLNEEDGSIDLTEYDLSSFINFINRPLRKEIETSIKIRHDNRIMVIWGNPPYNISTQNETPWINNLVNDYIAKESLEREDGLPPIKKIAGLKSMKGDEIKFHRFAQWKICKNVGQGIVAFISNGFFIDGIAARGMRKELKKAYDEIWVLNLYGGKEKKPVGVKKDENVFGGNKCARTIAITFMMRYPPHIHSENNCKIMYAEKVGSRVDKLEWLNNNSIETLEWIEVKDRLDHEFTPLNISIDIYNQYNYFPPVSDLFFVHDQAFISARDSLVTNVDKERLIFNLNRFFDGDFANLMDHKYKKHKVTTIGKKYADDEVSFQDTPIWNIEEALRLDREKILNSIQPFLFRAFDRQYVTFIDSMLHRARFDTLQYMVKEQQNIGLIVNRDMNSLSGSSLFITDILIHNKVMEGAGGQNSSIFPMLISYQLYDKKSRKIRQAKDSNINQKIKKFLKFKTKDRDIFYYIHAILQTPKYREVFRSLIIRDFPRIPFPTVQKIFQQYVTYGKQIALLQLVRHKGELHNYSENTPIYELLIDESIEDVITYADTLINDSFLELNRTEALKIKNYHFEGENSDVFDSDGNLIQYKIFFDKNFDDEDEIFWISGVTVPMWEYEVGGKKIIDEWLNNRKFSNPPKKKSLTRPLKDNDDELNYLRLMISSIKNILIIQEKMDDDFKLILDNLQDFSLANLEELSKKIVPGKKTSGELMDWL